MKWNNVRVTLTRLWWLDDWVRTNRRSVRSSSSTKSPKKNIGRTGSADEGRPVWSDPQNSCCSCSDAGSECQTRQRAHADTRPPLEAPTMCWRASQLDHGALCGRCSAGKLGSDIHVDVTLTRNIAGNKCTFMLTVFPEGLVQLDLMSY